MTVQGIISIVMIVIVIAVIILFLLICRLLWRLGCKN
nr:MAG TPA: SCIMP protein [Microviridae sp.]